MAGAAPSSTYSVSTVRVKDVQVYLQTRNKQLIVRLLAASTRTYEGESGTGTVSTLLVVDATCDVQLTFFGQPELYNRLRVGDVYYVPLEGAKIKPAKKFNRARLPCEVTLAPNCHVRLASGADALNVPTHCHQFVPIESLSAALEQSHVDIIGIVVALEPVTEYTRKSGATGVRRVIELVDESKRSIKATIFTTDGVVGTISRGTVAALRGTVDKWEGITKLTVWPDGFTLSPSFPAATALAELWRRQPWEYRPLDERWDFTRIDKLAEKLTESTSRARVDVAGVVISLEPAVGYVSKAGSDALRCDVTLSDASHRSVRVRLFLAPHDDYAFALGMGLALHASVELWNGRVSLRAFSDGVATHGVAEAASLAEQFRTTPWTATPLLPKLECVARLADLADHADGVWVEVAGVIATVEDVAVYSASHKDSELAEARAAVAGHRRVVELTDATGLPGAPMPADAVCVRATVFSSGDADLADLAAGQMVTLRGTVSIWRNHISLTASRANVTCSGVDERLAAREAVAPFKRLVAPFDFVGIDELTADRVGAHIDMLGVVTAFDQPVATQRGNDTQGTRQSFELSDAHERCVRVVVFSDVDDPTTGIFIGSIVALRSAKVSEWQGVMSLTVSGRTVVCDPDVEGAAVLREVAMMNERRAARSGDAMDVADESEGAAAAARAAGARSGDAMDVADESEGAAAAARAAGARSGDAMDVADEGEGAAAARAAGAARSGDAMDVADESEGAAAAARAVGAARSGDARDAAVLSTRAAVPGAKSVASSGTAGSRGARRVRPSSDGIYTPVGIHTSELGLGDPWPSEECPGEVDEDDESSTQTRKSRRSKSKAARRSMSSKHPRPSDEAVEEDNARAQIMYRDLSGHHRTLDGVCARDSAASVLQRIADKMGVSAQTLWLAKEGKELDMCAPCGIGKHETVHVLSRLDGGGGAHTCSLSDWWHIEHDLADSMAGPGGSRNSASGAERVALLQDVGSDTQCFDEQLGVTVGSKDDGGSDASAAPEESSGASTPPTVDLEKLSHSGHITLVNHFVTEGQFGLAIPHLEQVVKVEPTPFFLYKLGECYREIGNMGVTPLPTKEGQAWLDEQTAEERELLDHRTLAALSPLAALSDTADMLDILDGLPAGQQAGAQAGSPCNSWQTAVDMAPPPLKRQRAFFRAIRNLAHNDDGTRQQLVFNSVVRELGGGGALHGTFDSPTADNVASPKMRLSPMAPLRLKRQRGVCHTTCDPPCKRLDVGFAASDEPSSVGPAEAVCMGGLAKHTANTSAEEYVGYCSM